MHLALPHGPHWWRGAHTAAPRVHARGARIPKRTTYQRVLCARCPDRVSTPARARCSASRPRRRWCHRRRRRRWRRSSRRTARWTTPTCRSPSRRSRPAPSTRCVTVATCCARFGRCEHAPCASARGCCKRTAYPPRDAGAAAVTTGAPGAEPGVRGVQQAQQAEGAVHRASGALRAAPSALVRRVPATLTNRGRFCGRGPSWRRCARAAPTWRMWSRRRRWPSRETPRPRGSPTPPRRTRGPRAC